MIWYRFNDYLRMMSTTSSVRQSLSLVTAQGSLHWMVPNICKHQSPVFTSLHSAVWPFDLGVMTIVWCGGRIFCVTVLLPLPADHSLRFVCRVWWFSNAKMSLIWILMKHSKTRGYSNDTWSPFSQNAWRFIKTYHIVSWLCFATALSIPLDYQ